MLENRFTTKMSIDKKSLQQRFSKIRSKNGRLSKLLAVIIFLVLLTAIASASVYVALKQGGNENIKPTKEETIVDALAKDEYVVENSMQTFSADEVQVKELINILSKRLKLENIDIKKGNYDVTICAIEGKYGKSQRMFLMTEDIKGEIGLLLSADLSEEFYSEIISLFKGTEKEFYCDEIFDLKAAEIIIGNKIYPVLDSANLPKIEAMLSKPKIIKGATKCPFDAELILTRSDGVTGKITLATDSCAVYTSNGAYYDYSDGDNSKFFSFFGLDSQKLISLLYK